MCHFFGMTSPREGARYLQALMRKGMTLPGYQLTEAGIAATEAPLPRRRTACATL